MREEEKKKIKERDQRVDRDPDFVQICRLNFLRKENSILRGLFQADPKWIPIEVEHLHS